MNSMEEQKEELTQSELSKKAYLMGLTKKLRTG